MRNILKIGFKFGEKENKNFRILPKEAVKNVSNCRKYGIY